MDPLIRGLLPISVVKEDVLLVLPLGMLLGLEQRTVVQLIERLLLILQELLLLLELRLLAVHVGLLHKLREVGVHHRELLRHEVIQNLLLGLLLLLELHRSN